MKTITYLIVTASALAGAAALAADRPNTSPPVTAAELDKLAAPYVAQARATYPAAKKRFLAGLPRGYTFLVMFRFHEIRKRGGTTYGGEDMLVEVQSIKNGRVYGRLANKPEVMKSIKRGDSVSRPESEIKNWIIEHPDGSEEGNAVGKNLERYFSQRQ
jgi:uncharacterized protein YegJ (DUF2314 family)